MEAPAQIDPDTRPNNEIEVRRMTAADLSRWEERWDAQPSWQNSNDAITRCEAARTILGAFIDGECAGYAVFTNGLGRIAQFMIDRRFRKIGIASRLLMEMQADLTPDSKMQVINLDHVLTDTVQFFEKRGFRKVLAQFEMHMTL